MCWAAPEKLDRKESAPTYWAGRVDKAGYLGLEAQKRFGGASVDTMYHPLACLLLAGLHQIGNIRVYHHIVFEGNNLKLL